MLDRFSGLVRHAAVRHDGKVVKQIGDAFMLVFDDAADAIACGLELRDAAADEPELPAVRIGAHTGDVLYREGDYVGTNVNIAARVAALAERDQFLITAATRTTAGESQERTYRAQGAQHLKGIAEEVEVFDAQRAETADSSSSG
jgi:class 3 adenylate cyclase